MKRITIYLIILLVGAPVMVFPLNGNNYEKGNNRSVNDIAESIVAKLNQEVVLTDSQKVIVKQHAKIFVSKTQNTNELDNSDSTRTLRKSYIQEYKAALDAVLTEEQKALLVKKQEERRDAAMDKYTSSDNKTQDNEDK